MSLEQRIAAIARTIFLPEFSFAANRFQVEKDGEVELADHVVWVDDLLIAIQMKERQQDLSGANWFENKVLKKATRQVRDTLSFLSKYDAIVLENQRGHQFRLEPARLARKFMVVVYDYRNRSLGNESQEHRILVVADRPDELENLRRAASGIGGEVVSASTLNEAIAILDDCPCDVVVTDVQMTGSRTGVRILEAAIQRDPSTQVIVTTSHPSMHDSTEVMELGAFDYIDRRSHGVNSSFLVSKINRALKYREVFTRARGPDRTTFTSPMRAFRTVTVRNSPLPSEQFFSY